MRPKPIHAVILGATLAGIIIAVELIGVLGILLIVWIALAIAAGASNTTDRPIDRGYNPYNRNKED